MRWENLDLFMKNKRHYFWLGVIEFLPWLMVWIPSPVRRVVYDTIASISPDVPTNLQRLAEDGNGWRVFGYGFLAGLILCFGMTFALTVVAGTWAGTDPNTVYFRDDWQSIVLYLIVCPSYVGWCSWIIALFLGRSMAISAFADEIGGNPRRFWLARFPVALIIIVSITIIIVFNYIVDILEVSNVPEAYWFMTKPIGGIRYLNKVGIYYVILNFCLLLVTVAAIFCFFSMFFDRLRVGHGLRTLEADTSINFEAVARRLASFTEAYLIAKLLCMAYILNIVIWRLSPLGATANVHLASLALAAMGLFFISFPRNYVELMWRDYQLKAGREHAEFQDIRSPRERVIVAIVDTFFISTFVLNYFSLTNIENMKNLIGGMLMDVIKLLGVMN